MKKSFIVILKFLFKITFLLLFTLYFFLYSISSFSKIYSTTFNISSAFFNTTFILTCVRKVLPFTLAISSIILSYIFLNPIFLLLARKIFTSAPKNMKKTSDEFSICIGKNISNTPIYLSEKSLYQNLLITGAIGTGKTTGIIYPIINELLNFNNVSGLILDVKGNMQNTINEIIATKNTKYSLVIIELNGKVKYNPLHKPKQEPYMIADRLIQILKLFSNNAVTDTYWYDKASQLLTEMIKLIRLYNNNYVTFIELHKLITSKQYIEEKIDIVKELFLANKLTHDKQVNFNSVLSYYKDEYCNLDDKILSIILSETSRITRPFIADTNIAETFCCQENELNFFGFNNIYNTVVLLNTNILTYPTFSKILAAYLKLDFQSEMLSRSFPISFPTFFISDEYQEYVTENDANFFSLSREFKVVNIISTQSYSSLLKALNNEHTVQTIIQSLINKILLRTDDIYTIEQTQKLFGKEDKIKISTSFSENAHETNYNYLLNSLRSKKSNISESISTYTYSENIYDSKDFSLSLHIFEGIAYISKGTHMLTPFKIFLTPYFQKEVLNEKKT